MQNVAGNICGYFDLVSNMLPEIEQPSISGKMLLTRSQLLPATCCLVYAWLNTRECKYISIFKQEPPKSYGTFLIVTHALLCLHSVVN